MERAGETKAMQQSERERHDPRPALGQSRLALAYGHAEQGNDSIYLYLGRLF